MAPPLVGSAGVFAGLRQDLGLGWGLTLVAVTALGAMLALRGVHHRVEAEQARRNVFDAGAGSTAWVMLLMGAAVIPGLVLNAIDDAGVRAVVAGLLGAVLAAAAHGILAATTTFDVEMQGRVHRTRGEVFAEQAIQRGPRKVLLDRRRCHQRSGQYN
ncbi:putative membrane protein [Micrococcus aloeverae]|uniref:Membrane protein n=1 Tax=Micrococcus aloeverae TaxID=1391911 RepID=A0ABR6DZQ6_9MICC|nr:hypothetical protein [Micrococcus aloeverae]MBA9081391.1 putative membrane protein [Micrococcus aloeverae]